MKTLTLSNGKVVKYDDCDHALIEPYKWNGVNYVSATFTVFLNKRKSIYMHRLIMGFPDGKQVDHINGDTFDNRRENLRICTHQENCWNKSKPVRKTRSRFKGVVWLHGEDKWMAHIGFNKKRFRLGAFKSEIDAAICYNEGALRFYGPFAKLNEVENVI